MFVKEVFVAFSCCMAVLVSSIISTDASALPKKTTFDLYHDKKSPREPMEVGDVHSFVTGHFDTCKKTVFVVTGFNQPDDHPDIMTAARSLAAKEYNTIVVNFETLEYFKAPTNTGRDIAEFLKYLTELFNYNRDNIILLGVSLGTHVVGVAGYFFPGIGRIIAIDPAGPFYDIMPAAYRINKSSAKYVDVLHCSKAYGSLRRDLGHVNYVLNGGMMQPGCPWIEPGTKKMPNFGCNHLRGAYLTLASMNRCEFKFYKCPGYMEYKMGLCKKAPRLVFGMALDVRTAPRDGSYYYHDVTQVKYPFCMDTERVKPNFTGRIC